MCSATCHVHWLSPQILSNLRMLLNSLTTHFDIPGYFYLIPPICNPSALPSGSLFCTYLQTISFLEQATLHTASVVPYICIRCYLFVGLYFPYVGFFVSVFKTIQLFDLHACLKWTLYF